MRQQKCLSLRKDIAQAKIKPRIITNPYLTIAEVLNCEEYFVDLEGDSIFSDFVDVEPEPQFTKFKECLGKCIVQIKKARKRPKYRHVERVFSRKGCRLPLHRNELKCSCSEACATPDCPNYATNVECDAGTCNHKQEDCLNRRFASLSKERISLRPFLTEWKGVGLSTLEDIEADELVIEITGELIDRDVLCNRLDKSKVGQMMYAIELGNDLFIDMKPKGNFSRFINHSCDPNLRVEKWYVDELPRLGLFATRTIESFEELSFDYNFASFDENIECKCGSKNCRGNLNTILKD
ncbi:hypothetical protein PCE1_004258 [Barthelona sp. PCE]